MCSEKRAKLHKKHGCPYPTGHTIATDVKARAVEIAADHKKLLIRYIRKNPKLGMTIKENRDRYDNPTYSVLKGEIIGVLIAFKDGAGKLLIGWSQRHSTNEPLSFTREDARVCAVLRGLLDSITIESKEKVLTTVPERTLNKKSLDQQYVPSPLKYHLPSFMNRAFRYFKVDKIDNVSDERTVADAQSGKA